MPNARITSSTGEIDLYFEGLRNAEKNAALLERDGVEAKARNFATNSTRRGFADKDPRGPGIFMKRHIPHAGLVMLPMAGYAINIEEPSLFNQHVAEFLTSVESGRWGPWKRSR